MMRFRRITQVAGAILCNGYFSALTLGHAYKGPLKGICLPVINCYACPMAIFSCPIGSMQHFMAIHTFPFLLVGLIGLFGLTLGRLTCGWICPFGLLQDLLYKIPVQKIHIPGIFAHFKYATLVLLVIIIPYLTGDPWFSKLCPAGTLTAGIPWVLMNPQNSQTGQAVIAPGAIGPFFLLKLAILGGFLALFAMAKRPFCRTTCPLGAIFSLFNRFSVVQLKVDRGCRGCGSCQERCPVGLTANEGAGSGECIRCLSCTSCSHVSVGVGALGYCREPDSPGTKDQ